ncbi:MAG: cbb3-type cytochrome c oxidase subunit II [Waddliaceae bacterium]
MSENSPGFMHKVDLSAVLTVAGIILLFSGAVIVTLIVPGYMDETWVQPTSAYQVQMYEVVDPSLYISRLGSETKELQSVYRLKKHFSLLAFQESETVRFIAPPEFQQYITKYQDPILKLTSNLFFLRKPKPGPKNSFYQAVEEENRLRKAIQDQWREEHPDGEEKSLPRVEILELFQPQGDEAFSLASTDRTLEDWVDKNFVILDEKIHQPYHKDPGVIYVRNPREYRVSSIQAGKERGWRYDPDGEPILSVAELTSHPLGFRSRQELIAFGEHLYAVEGCWYCHTDQTRTLIQDVVLNGSESFPAPPSSANEYIYQKITFPGTRRIGPDLSRVGVKRPSRDWHQSHFWSPQTASRGSIMPSFQHFFDDDPRGKNRTDIGIPNYQFEAIFQYLMTKGTRITPPTEAWWIGKDPIQTKAIIQGEKKLP